jgi:hypothetical protein
MYYVGIDISKYKHYCFICTETEEVIEENYLSQTPMKDLINYLIY